MIEQTEGLVAIDVNTGKFTGTRNLEETVFKTNMEAAHEVARQLRLRDVGGIVIIDFIDMDYESHRRKLARTFKEAVRRDRAKTNIMSLSELGLIEMTRQRIRPSLESAVYDTCDYCQGKGLVKSSEAIPHFVCSTSLLIRPCAAHRAQFLARTDATRSAIRSTASRASDDNGVERFVPPWTAALRAP